MKKIILSAYACDPSKGSEPSYGFNWAKQLSTIGYEVYCITTSRGKKSIGTEPNLPENLHFIFVNTPGFLNKFYYMSKLGMYLHYFVWQWIAYRKAKVLHKNISFDLAHHVTWGSIQQGSFMYKLNIPFIFGPAGGGQNAPKAFKCFFYNHWNTERKRDIVSHLLQRWNPACRTMLKKANVVLVSNNETLHLAKTLKAKHVQLFFDVALPASFFPETLPVRGSASPQLHLLWVGRFLPRKGLLLVIEVMAKLVAYPEIQLTVVGDGEMRKLFLEAVERLKLYDKIKWVGSVPFREVKKYYATHDVFLFSSLRDSGGIQLIEAMAYGLPVITLNLHGSGLIVEADRGIKVEVTNPEDTIEKLAQAVLVLYEDREKLKALSEGAFTFAKQQTWENTVERVTSKFYK